MRIESLIKQLQNRTHGGALRTTAIIFASLAVASLLLLSAYTALYKYPQDSIHQMGRIGIPEQIISLIFARDEFVLMHLGYYHFGGKGEYDLAATESYFRRALLLAPEEQMIHFNLARVAFLRSRFNEAIRLTIEEERLNPNLDRIYYLRGLIYGYDKKFPEAEAAFLEFNRRQPDTWAGHVDLAWIYFQQGKYAKVKSTIEEILPYQNNAWLQNSYGLALLNLGEKERARVAFLEAKELAANLTPERWGVAYGGNDPAFYERGLTEMRMSIEGNLGLTH